jgi:hypothetical protein
VKVVAEKAPKVEKAVKVVAEKAPKAPAKKKAAAAGDSVDS